MDVKFEDGRLNCSDRLPSLDEVPDIYRTRNETSQYSEAKLRLKLRLYGADSNGIARLNRLDECR